MRKAVGCRPSPTFEKSVLQRAAGRNIGSEERTERPKLGFRHVVPKDGRICHTLELSVYMPGWSCIAGWEPPTTVLISNPRRQVEPPAVAIVGVSRDQVDFWLIPFHTAELLGPL